MVSIQENGAQRPEKIPSTPSFDVPVRVIYVFFKHPSLWQRINQVLLNSHWVLKHRREDQQKRVPFFIAIACSSSSMPQEGEWMPGEYQHFWIQRYRVFVQSPTYYTSFSHLHGTDDIAIPRVLICHLLSLYISCSGQHHVQRSVTTEVLECWAPWRGDIFPDSSQPHYHISCNFSHIALEREVSMPQYQFC